LKVSSAVSEFLRSVKLSLESDLLGQGKELGIVRGYRVYLLRQLRIRFGNQVDDDILWRLGEADSKQLLRWSERVLTETTLPEVLFDDPW
jgi:hypothetical protein